MLSMYAVPVMRAVMVITEATSTRAEALFRHSQGRSILHEIFWWDAYQGKVARICDATLVIHEKQGGERRVLEHRLVVQASNRSASLIST